MSRSGYSDDCENMELWRAAVERAIRGKRGQKFLKELESALLALPEKKLCSYDVADPVSGEVCAVGAVALKRKLDKGADRAAALKEIAEKFPEGCEAEELCDEFDIARALAKEITFINDEDSPSDSCKRYESVLQWVREQIKAQTV